MPILTTDRLPSIWNRTVDRDIADRVVCFWRGEQLEPELRRDLEPDERQALVRRAGELRNALAPAPATSRNVLLGAIGAMLGAFPQMTRHSDETATAIAAGYLWTARERPHWAIVRACEMVRSGAADRTVSFCPSEPEFNTLIGGLVVDYERRLRAAERLLDARLSPPCAPPSTREEIEARLGRPIGEVDTRAQPEPPALHDGNHLARVMADVEARKRRRVAEQSANLSPKDERHEQS